MKYEETLFHLCLLITIILIGISITSCVGWTSVEYIDSPIDQEASWAVEKFYALTDVEMDPYT